MTKLLRVLLAEAMATIEGTQRTVRARLIGGLIGTTEKTTCDPIAIRHYP